MDIIDKYPDKNWDWGSYGLSSNPNITMEIMKICDKIGIGIISDNLNITMEMVNKYPDKDWDWSRLSSHDKLTMEIVEKYIDKPWDFKNVGE